jgi:8-oxo-dGTP pyrophosphatase MutT (NUDIX family)
MADHYVDVVDENDNIIGKELRSRKQELGFISRVVVMLIKDSKNRFIICKRSCAKADIPDKWDVSAAGAVAYGEAYEAAAKRELWEELNISCKLTMIEKFYQEFCNKDRKYRLFVGIFIGTS